MAGVAAIAVAGFVGGAGAAYGQDSEEQAEASTSIDVITVRARKREESIEDVPQSVTAISGDAAEEMGLQDVEGYVRQIPGAILVASGPDYLHDITLRGQGGGRLGFSESTTGIYRNGIYTAGGGFGGRSYSRIDFFDMQTMEVYRGPQGALYGRNAVGGAANVISRSVDSEPGGRLKVGYGSPDSLDVEAVINAPFGSGQSGIRLGGYHSEQTDGHYTLLDTGETLDTQEDWGARATIDLDLGPATQVSLLLETSQSDAPGFTTLGQNLVLDPTPFERAGLDYLDRVVIEQSSAIFQLDHEMDFADLTVLANYKVRDGDRQEGDFDHFIGFNSPLLDITDAQTEAFERFGVEARLASPIGSDLTWMAGVDYQAYTSDVTGIRQGTILGPFSFSAALRSQLRRDMSTEELTSYSAFGLVAFDLTDRLNLSLEARVQKDEKDFVFERVDGDPLTDETIAPTTFGGSWTRVLPTVSLSYEASDATTVYGRVATGYRPGGYNPTPVPGFFDRTEYDPEDIVSGEVGVKGVYRVGEATIRPELAVYYSVTNDVQQTTALSPTVNTFSLENVGDSTIYGAEFEVTATAPMGGGDVLASLGLSTTQGEFDDGASILFQGTLVDLSGLRVPRTRDYIVNLRTAYSHPITPAVDGLVSLSFAAEGGGYDNASHSRASESYEMFGLSLGLQGDGWRLLAFGNNLTDETYRLVEVNNNTYVNTPRTFGISLTLER